MGASVERSNFTEVDYRLFEGKLHKNIAALKRVLATPSFGVGASTLGAELELYLVDSNNRPLSINQTLEHEINDPHLALEMNRYNLEFNAKPVNASGMPFAALGKQFSEFLTKVDNFAAAHDGAVFQIGILPTLTNSDFGEHALTNEQRYHTLADVLRRAHKKEVATYGIDISGLDPLKLANAHVSLEGACTSLQLHYRVNPDDFVDTWNIVQLITPLVLGLSANSPFLMGHRLWHETRVPLFQQSVEGIPNHDLDWHLPRRVCFGFGWVRQNAAELFEQMARLYPSIIPQCSDEHPLQVVDNGGLPRLNELMMHVGTVWSWNRPIYSVADGGHLRIEMRSLPAGPTVQDMMANAALIIGLASGMKEQADKLTTSLPFQYAEYNFYKAARDGINARIVWPTPRHVGLDEISISALTEVLLPVAELGLSRLGVNPEESRRLLRIIERRAELCRNGATWQLSQYNRLRKILTKEKALQQMVALYKERSYSDTPVAEWTID
jgi:gamma-glutamyl:cysteine ligase YbdK (ATP-grasp superfamily)